MTMKPSYNNSLNGIVEGMPVYDANGEHIGTVAEVYLGGTERDANSGRSKSAAEDIRRAGRTLDHTDESIAFDADDMTDEIAEQLLFNGYFRVEGAGLTGAAAYIMPDRVSEVYDGQVKLSASLRNLREFPHAGKGERYE